MFKYARALVAAEAHNIATGANGNSRRTDGSAIDVATSRSDHILGMLRNVQPTSPFEHEPEPRKVSIPRAEVCGEASRSTSFTAKGILKAFECRPPDTETMAAKV